MSIHEHEGRKYLRLIHSAVAGPAPIEVDVYCVLEAFKVSCPAVQHAVKKLLCAGLRKKGSELQDLEEALLSIQRAAELAKSREKFKDFDPRKADQLVASSKPSWHPDGGVWEFVQDAYENYKIYRRFIESPPGNAFLFGAYSYCCVCILSGLISNSFDTLEQALVAARLQEKRRLDAQPKQR